MNVRRVAVGPKVHFACERCIVPDMVDLRSYRYAAAVAVVDLLAIRKDRRCRENHWSSAICVHRRYPRLQNLGNIS